MAHGDAALYTGLGTAPSVPPPLGERVQLGEEFARYIRELMITGHLRSAEPVNIDGLARYLKTRSIPVRELAQVLKGEGCVQAEPRRGFRIGPLRSQEVKDMFLVQADVINRPAEARKLTRLMGVVRYAPRVSYSSTPGWHDASLQDHEAIIDTIRNRDPATARRTMVEHIKHAGGLLVSHFESRWFGEHTTKASSG